MIIHVCTSVCMTIEDAASNSVRYFQVSEILAVMFVRAALVL